MGRGLIALFLLVAACRAAPDPRRAVPSYDPFTGRLVQLSADQNGDGVVDQWTYLDGNRPWRGEADTDGDGRVDRWEYFDANAQLERVGTSSRNDGVEDTWAYVTPVDGESRVVRSRIFRQAVPVASTDNAAIVAGLDAAMDAVFAEIAGWVLGGVA